ncbi:unnamed protein product [Urochloa humidicola]
MICLTKFSGLSEDLWRAPGWHRIRDATGCGQLATARLIEFDLARHGGYEQKGQTLGERDYLRVLGEMPVVFVLRPMVLGDYTYKYGYKGPAKNNYLVQYAQALSNMLHSAGLSATAAQGLLLHHLLEWQGVCARSFDSFGKDLL